MTFVPGKPKTGGRPPGALNKRSQELKELAEELGINPFEIMLRLAANDWEGLGYKEGERRIEVAGGGSYYEDVIPPALRGQMAKEAIKYLAPQLKSVEHSSDGSMGNTFIAVTKEQIKEAIALDPMLEIDVTDTARQEDEQKTKE